MEAFTALSAREQIDLAAPDDDEPVVLDETDAPPAQTATGTVDPGAGHESATGRA